MKKILVFIIFLILPIISFADEIFIPVELWLGENITESEKIIFPEVNFDKVDRIRGMDITIVTTANNKENSKALLEATNFPFIKKNTTERKN